MSPKSSLCYQGTGCASTNPMHQREPGTQRRASRSGLNPPRTFGSGWSGNLYTFRPQEARQLGVTFMTLQQKAIEHIA